MELFEALVFIHLEETVYAPHYLSGLPNAIAPVHMDAHEVAQLIEVGHDPGPGHAGPGPVGSCSIFKLSGVRALPADALDHQEIMAEPSIIGSSYLLDMSAVIDAVDQVHRLLALPTYVVTGLPVLAGASEYKISMRYRDWPRLL